MDKSDPNGAQYWKDKFYGIKRKEISVPTDAIKVPKKLYKEALSIFKEKENETN